MEEVVEAFIDTRGMWVAFVVLIAGAVVLTYSAEKLITYLTRAAFGLGVSIFMLAIVFTGFEFDDAVVALVFGASGHEQIALGTALGTALAITGITLAGAAIVHPFPVDVPRDYLVVFFVSPFLLVPFVLLGSLTTIHGLLLVAVFLLLLAYIVVREYHRDVPVFRNSELSEHAQADGGVNPDVVLTEIPEERWVSRTGRPGAAWLGLSAVALVGVVVGATLLEASSEVVVDSLGIEGTVFGATVLTLFLTFENLLLTLEPVRRGVPEIGVGHVLGSVIFSVTANVGVILFVSELVIPRAVLLFHLPAVILLTAIAAYAISTGRVQRRHGYVLAVLYLLYWLIGILAFGGIPIPDPL